MVAINFKKQFSHAVESGEKCQTIRNKSRVSAGDTIQLYTGQHTKQCRLLGEAVCCAVDNVTLNPDGPWFGNPGWHPKDRDAFARKDGFKDYNEMYAWFQLTYATDGPFNAYVIMWNPIKKVATPIAATPTGGNNE